LRQDPVAPQVGQKLSERPLAIDRGQGFGLLTGQFHRWRLRMMASQAELEHLEVWYAR